MSTGEIQEAVQELHQALSPEMVAFLQQRGKSKQPAPLPMKQEPVPLDPPLTTMPASNSSEGTFRNDTSMQEKERLASLLSSIRTQEDLDAAYETEIRRTATHGSLQDPMMEDETKDDWEVAVRLLRSTSSRQTVWAARGVCRHLQAQVRKVRFPPESGTATAATEPSPLEIPTTLSVSLRCLLDAPTTTGLVLHTYVLGALEALLQLQAHPEHVVYINPTNTTTTTAITTVCQEYFLEDAVATRPPFECYPSAANDVKPVALAGVGEAAVAYSTSSSATSAQEDGAAFTRDPLWTLLSRMKILPRLADLLLVHGMLVPVEAIQASCGILSMLSMRSPGAATAMVQHKTLLQTMLRQATLVPPIPDEKSDWTVASSGCVFLDPSRAIPGLVWLITIARQSRLVAASLPVDDFLPLLLALDEGGSEEEQRKECEMKRLGLQLWRILLRYGLGLTNLQTYISLSIPHLATVRPGPRSLAVEFSTCFANVLHCAKISVKKLPPPTMLASEQEQECLLSAFDWLSTSVQQTMEHLKKQRRIDDGSDSPPGFRLVASRLRLVHGYAATLEQRILNEPTGDDPHEQTTRALEELVHVTKSILESGILESALRLVPPCRLCLSTETNDCDTGQGIGVPLQQEASACACLESFASLLAVVLRLKSKMLSSGGLVDSSLTQFLRIVQDWMQSDFNVSPSRDNLTSRRGWLNKTFFAMCNCLVMSVTDYISDTAGHLLERVRSFAFALLARLESGEEAIAAVLFSSDILFRSDFSLVKEESPLSTFFMRELCTSNIARRQLDHSFKLLNGFGITTDGWGPFELESLLSEGHGGTGADSANLLLPLGKMWIWKVLSSTNSSETSATSAKNERGEIQLYSDTLSTCLALLVQMEKESLEHETDYHYASQVPMGSKMYHLLNICLQPETFIREGRTGTLWSTLYDLYMDGAKLESDSFFRAFSTACREHCRVEQRGTTMPNQPSESADTEKLWKIVTGDKKLSEELEAVKDFAIECCTAYTEYGAQYAAFTKCVRVFLSNQFPAKIRIEAVRRLRDVLHVLTLAEEENSPYGPCMQAVLESMLVGTCSADPPELLDLISSTLETRSGSVSSQVLLTHVNNGRPGFFYLFAVMLLSRRLASSVRRETAGTKRWQQWFHESDNDTTFLVVEIATKLLSLTDNEVVATVMEVCKDDCHMKSQDLKKGPREATWTAIVERLSRQMLEK